MDEKEILEKFRNILKPYVKNVADTGAIKESDVIMTDLGVNSSRLVDIVIAMEDAYNIEVSDDDAEKVHTVGDAVKLVKSKI